MIRRNIFFVFLTTPLLVLGQDFGDLIGMHVGCFLDNKETRDLEFQVPGQPNTIQLCIKECKKNFYLYAGSQNGRYCYCGNEYGKYGEGVCYARCVGDTSTICGGADSNTIYKTGLDVLAPPSNLRTKGEPKNSTISIEWDTPRVSNLLILEFKVLVHLNFSYSPDRSRFQNRSLKVSNTTLAANIIGLLPGSQYEVSVYALTEEGSSSPVSGLFWTEVGIPKQPSPPTIVKHDLDHIKGTIHAKLHPVEEFYGPITSYLVLVLDETTPSPFDPETLLDYDTAKAEGLNYWVTAELDTDYLHTHEEFTIGDNQEYRGYKNHGPLRDRDYHVSLAAVSQLNGVTRRSFAMVSHDQHAVGNMVVFKFESLEDQSKDDDHDHDHDENEKHEEEKVGVQETFLNTITDTEPDTEELLDSTATTVLTVSIVVAAVLLILAVGFFMFIRYSLGKRFRRRRTNNQELLTTVPTMDPQESGYLDNDAFETEQQRTQEEYFQSLDGKVWQIPRNFVEVQNEVLGRGKFGTAMKGTVSMNNEIVPCNVYIIPNKMMDKTDRLNMLKELDLNIKAKFHENITNLIGICEEQETTLLVLDPAEIELKQLLLDSRSLDTHPSYAEKSNRFSSIREEDAISIMVGIAEGLDHLTHSGVQIRQLCSRMVYMGPGYRPKIFGFGVAEYNKRPRSLDYTRWSSPETLLKNQFSCKSAAWSFGCIMWEIVTLGATPYCGLRTREVKSRILQGLRLPQTRYTSDILYQLMLTCWMTDPSERPDFSTVLDSFSDMVTSQQGLLWYSLYPEFQYEEYNPELEFVSSS